MSALGCGPVVQSGDEGSSGETGADASTGGGGPSTTSTPPSPTSASTTAPVPPPPLPTTETTSGWDTSGSADDPPPFDPCACNFLCEPCPVKGCPGYDPECGVPFECSIWDQDCPDGEKCMPWANDGSSVWNATRCAPVDPNPDQVGAPCTVEGSGQSGIDSCDISQMCFDVDADNNGTCVGFCGGSEADPVCPDGQACFISNEGSLALCLPTCDPLLPTCAEGDGCFPTEGTEAFVCLPAPSENIDSSWTCQAIGGCEPGTLCVDSSFVPGCDDAMCCAPYCDVGSPTCPPDTECLPFWEDGEAPPEFANLGVCGSV